MESLEDELATARGLSIAELAAAIESIGFECTRCGACCTADESVERGSDTDRVEGSGDDDQNGDSSDIEREDHTATIFPDEVRTIRDRSDDTTEEWRDVARPMPYGLGEDERGNLRGETFEWALQTDACGDCVFYEESEDDVGACGVHENRPLICRTYPFSVALAGTSQPMGEAVDEDGIVRVHECEGLGRDISRADAEELAAALKERAVRELEEAIAIRDGYEPVADTDTPVVHDSEGAKRADGSSIDR